MVSSSDPEPIMSAFTGFEEVETILARGRTRSSVRLRTGIQVDLRVVEEREFPCALLYFTGSKQHNIAMRARALQDGAQAERVRAVRGHGVDTARRGWIEASEVLNVLSVEELAAKRARP